MMMVSYRPPPCRLLPPLLLLLLPPFFHGSLALRIIGMVVPSEVVAGRDALLECHYDLEGSSLYALKWYKGSHEFYRFILKEVPPVQTFPWSSITIHHEEARSRIFAAPLAGRVLLRNVTAAAEGVYKCEISTEAPYFDTDFEEANLSVIEVSNENPIISWLQGRPDWEYDDVFHFKCSMNGTRPASRLSWLLNGQPVPSSMVEPSEPVLIKNDASATGGGRYFSAQSAIRFKMQPHLFGHTHTQLEVTCVSRVGGLRESLAAEVLEGRAKWIIRHPGAAAAAAAAAPTAAAAAAAGGVRQVTPSAPVDKWPKTNKKQKTRAKKRRRKKKKKVHHVDDADVANSGANDRLLEGAEGGDVGEGEGDEVVETTEPHHGEGDDEDVVDGDELEEEDSVQVGRRDDDEIGRNNAANATRSGDDDGTAQSISDSESPSRRTQPVVGSHPGRGNNKSSPVAISNKAGPLAGLQHLSVTNGCCCLMLFLHLVSVSF